MDYLMGLKGKDFVMVCSDSSAVQQIITIKHDEDKLIQVDDHALLATSGELTPAWPRRLSYIYWLFYMASRLCLILEWHLLPALSPQAPAHKYSCLTGEAGDRVQFTEFIKANIQLYKLRNGRGLSTKAIANYLRGELATALRKVRYAQDLMQVLAQIYGQPDLVLCLQRPYMTNLLIAGFDTGKGPSLYWCDYLATMHKMNIAGTGYGAPVL